ncbi:acyl-CoA dehydrogenase family protein [Dermatobacter hominis]|uniref:acyl-CoA dehydrogenase family protein n=1 Tax=Dermatobacter hominis TaxID=2884263 RepID=UPI001D0F8E3D|nr:acyl-CoA dehydrogenase family protein [Dermatobacter hominis]UDY36652.1 hypothetical protein LH044_03715 [Dermatobacter hominis]
MTASLDATEVDILATALRQAAATRTGPDLDAALDEIGWLDAVALVPRAAVAALFEAQGAAGTTSGALGRLLADGLGIPLEPGGVPLLPAFGTARPPAGRRDGTVDVDGLADASITAASRVVLVAAGSDGAPSWTTVPTGSLVAQEVRGLDPDLRLVAIAADGLADPGGWRPAGSSWDGAVATARLALGHELVGTMRTMLGQARQHALDRVQFDRPIAGFQAVRHRLAEALVAVEAAEAALDGAWTDGSPLAAAIAGAACGHGARTVRRHCQQVLAGIGFTTEHDLHRSVRRSIVLDGLLGDARTVTAEVGAAVLAGRRLPDLLPL